MNHQDVNKHSMYVGKTISYYASIINSMIHSSLNLERNLRFRFAKCGKNGMRSISRSETEKASNKTEYDTKKKQNELARKRNKLLKTTEYAYKNSETIGHTITFW